MRRSRYKRTKRVKKDRKRLLVLFSIGLLIGVLAFILFKVYTEIIPPRLPKIEKKLPLPPKKVVLAKIAIVLDDFGYNYKNVEAVFGLKEPITFSILPNHPYSKTISRRAWQKGYEEILHLPLEPYENDKYIRPELTTITTNMKKVEVLDKLTKDLGDVPFAKGVSNHQGSKATEDTVLMQAIFTELKNRNLFFLDSLVTNRSVCRKVARDIGLKLYRRDVFLDNKEDFEYIKGQMQQLIKKAKRSGSAIGIGHDRTKTVLALYKLMPEAKEQGIEFVFLSELVK